jgi:hypothetical protein
MRANHVQGTTPEEGWGVSDDFSSPVITNGLPGFLEKFSLVAGEPALKLPGRNNVEIDPVMLRVSPPWAPPVGSGMMNERAF